MVDFLGGIRQESCPWKILNQVRTLIIIVDLWSDKGLSFQYNDSFITSFINAFINAMFGYSISVLTQITSQDIPSEWKASRGCDEGVGEELILIDTYSRLGTLLSNKFTGKSRK